MLNQNLQKEIQNSFQIMFLARVNSLLSHEAMRVIVYMLWLSVNEI